MNLTVLWWIGVYQEMMPEAQSVEAFLVWWDACSIACCGASSMLAPARRTVGDPRGEVRTLVEAWGRACDWFVDVTTGGTNIRLNVSRGEGTAKFAS